MAFGVVMQTYLGELFVYDVILSISRTYCQLCLALHVHVSESEVLLAQAVENGFSSRFILL